MMARCRTKLYGVRWVVISYFTSISLILSKSGVFHSPPYQEDDESQRRLQKTRISIAC